jgi:hypothetical protein
VKFVAAMAELDNNLFESCVALGAGVEVVGLVDVEVEVDSSLLLLLLLLAPRPTVPPTAPPIMAATMSIIARTTIQNILGRSPQNVVSCFGSGCCSLSLE